MKFEIELHHQHQSRRLRLYIDTFTSLKHHVYRPIDRSTKIRGSEAIETIPEKKNFERKILEFSHKAGASHKVINSENHTPIFSSFSDAVN